MATNALQSGRVLANVSHDGFDAAVRHYASQKALQALLPPARTLPDELGAADAVEAALARVISCPVPDIAALGHKLDIVLRAAGADAMLRGFIAADVRRLAGEGRA